MIKPQELRLGNYIKYGHDIEQVSVRHLQMLVERQAEFDAVPLRLCLTTKGDKPVTVKTYKDEKRI